MASYLLSISNAYRHNLKWKHNKLPKYAKEMGIELNKKYKINEFIFLQDRNGIKPHVSLEGLQSNLYAPLSSFVFMEEE